MPLIVDQRVSKVQGHATNGGLHPNTDYSGPASTFRLFDCLNAQQYSLVGEARPTAPTDSRLS